MGEHTKEPWLFDERVGCVAIYAGEKRNCLDTGEPFITYAKGHWDEVKGHWDVDPAVVANFHRIVACVNACAGISTHDLESDLPSFRAVIKTEADMFARITELESALAKSASREAALVEKLKVATDLLDEGNKGFGRILIASSDDKAVRDWQKRCGAALAKIKEAGK